MERVIVTGSNIPTAQETGPNPVDTYRPADIEKLGVRNSTDFLTNLPQEMGTTNTQRSIGLGGDGSVIPNLRGLLPKETSVLIDGKRVAIVGSGGAFTGGPAGVDINLIPFPMIDHIDILKDGASAVYGSDAVAGVINIFLLHKFRGLEIGGSYGNTNLGASNDMGEREGWIKAGTGDDKTDILVIADFYDRAAIYSRDRNIESNGFVIPWGGGDFRYTSFPGRIGFGIGFRLIPRLFFSANSPPPHSAPNVATSPFYVNPVVIAPNIYPGPPGIIGPHARQHRPETLGTYGYKGGGEYVADNLLAETSDIPPADRQSYYGSFTRDICDKYLTVFADFKYTRSFFNAKVGDFPFGVDPFKGPSGLPFSPIGISVPIQNPFNPFTVADATLIYNGVPVPVTTGVSFKAINDEPRGSYKTTFHDLLFDIGVRGEMDELGDYFKSWNWELGFRYSRNNEDVVLGPGGASSSATREALLDTNPATAFNPFLGSFGRNSNAAISKVYFTLTNSGQFEVPLGYFAIDGDLFHLPAGPVSFAAGLEYRGERWRFDPSSEQTTFNVELVGMESSRVNRDVWATYQEARFPVTSPLWNFPGAYSLEFDIAEREEWYSQNTSAALPVAGLPFVPAQHSQYNAQKPKFSVRWQPLDPKWIGALTLRGSYSEAFHAPTLPDLTPAGTKTADQFGFSVLGDPRGLTPPGTIVPVIVSGNPNLRPEVAYEWTCGAVYSPRWVKGLTLSTDFWHIDLRSIASFVGAQFILDFENSFPGLVIRDPATGAVTEITNPSLNLTRAIVEGTDYEAIYILDSAIFGHGDFGRLTVTLNGTYLSRFEFQATPVSKRIGISGEFVAGAAFTGSLPHNRDYASAFYDGPADTWLAGFDTGATVHYTGQYEDGNGGLTGSSKPQEPRSGPFPWRARKVSDWVTLDLIAPYTFNLPPPASAGVPGLAKDGGKNVKMKDGDEKNVLPVSTAEYHPCGWRAWLNNTTFTLGMQNVFDFDPPFVSAAFGTNYDQSLATIKGRFWYAQLKKRF